MRSPVEITKRGSSAPCDRSTTLFIFTQITGTNGQAARPLAQPDIGEEPVIDREIYRNVLKWWQGEAPPKLANWGKVEIGSPTFVPHIESNVDHGLHMGRLIRDVIGRGAYASPANVLMADRPLSNGTPTPPGIRPTLALCGAFGHDRSIR